MRLEVMFNFSPNSHVSKCNIGMFMRLVCKSKSDVQNHVKVVLSVSN